MEEDFGMFGDWDDRFERDDDYNVYEEHQLDLDQDAGEGFEYESLQDEIEVEMMAEGIGE